MTKPTRVHPLEFDRYWLNPPPELSARCRWWVGACQSGWKPNRRIRTMGYYSAAMWFGVYIWEYVHILAPVIYPPRLIAVG